MSRYIDADALLKDLKEELEIDSPMLNEVENKWINKGIRIAIKDVKRFPTADVVEVRHGHWIEHIEKPDWLEDDVEVFYNCSECGTSHWSITPPFCPNCGAKMDGERREE